MSQTQDRDNLEIRQVISLFLTTAVFGGFMTFISSIALLFDSVVLFGSFCFLFYSYGFPRTCPTLTFVCS